jgi:hypothetical protein
LDKFEKYLEECANGERELRMGGDEGYSGYVWDGVVAAFG